MGQYISETANGLSRTCANRSQNWFRPWCSDAESLARGDVDLSVESSLERVVASHSTSFKIADWGSGPYGWSPPGIIAGGNINVIYIRDIWDFLRTLTWGRAQQGRILHHGKDYLEYNSFLSDTISPVEMLHLLLLMMIGLSDLLTGNDLRAGRSLPGSLHDAFEMLNGWK